MTATTGPVAHQVHITDVASWSVDRLGFDARHAMGVRDWLATPTQRLGTAFAALPGIAGVAAALHEAVGTVDPARR